jgi:hypothetical protein
MRARRNPWPADTENNRPVPTEINRFGAGYMVGLAGEDAVIEGDIYLGSAAALALRQALLERLGPTIIKAPGQTAADALGLRRSGAVAAAPHNFLADSTRPIRLSPTARDLLFALSRDFPVLRKAQLTTQDIAFISEVAKEAEAFIQEFEAAQPEAILQVPVALGQLWDSLPIRYDASAFGGARRQQIDRAARLWNESTGITLFAPGTGISGPHIRLISGDGCSSFVGQSTRQPQPIKLGNGCTEGAIRHEFGHALGLFHEQSHPDRDQFVTIRWENIKPSARYNFRIATNISKPSSYDYCSIMHYGANAFGGGKQTIVPKQPGVQIGQRHGPSPMDVQMIRALYRRP